MAVQESCDTSQSEVRTQLTQLSNGSRGSRKPRGPVRRVDKGAFDCGGVREPPTKARDFFLSERLVQLLVFLVGLSLEERLDRNRGRSAVGKVAQTLAYGPLGLTRAVERSEMAVGIVVPMAVVILRIDTEGRRWRWGRERLVPARDAPEAPGWGHHKVEPREAKAPAGHATAKRISEAGWRLSACDESLRGAHDLEGTPVVDSHDGRHPLESRVQAHHPGLDRRGLHALTEDLDDCVEVH